MAKAKTKTPKNPFKDVKDLKREVTSFINYHKAFIHNQAKRISDYFEMCCFNYIVRYYENSGYDVCIENLIDGKYRYKLTTAGYAVNFSHFKVKSSAIDGRKSVEYEIHHNLAVQSGHETDIFTTPDVVVINAASIVEDNNFYPTKKVFNYVSNKNAQTFCEAKQFAPFPELIFSFIGTVNELRTDLIIGIYPNSEPFHIAPSLLISGKGNPHTERIKDSLQKRYGVNIVSDLFNNGIATFSKKNLSTLKTIGHK